MTPVTLPQAFKQRVVGAFPNGGAWLEMLPALIAECEDRWKIGVGPPFDLSFNYVAPAVTSTGQEVVIKLGVPNPELTAEIHALQSFQGGPVVRLLNFDEDRGFLLTERLVPGHPLSSLADDEEATRVAARTMRELWRPAPAQGRFPTVVEWARGLERLRKRFDGSTGPFPARLVDMAEHLFSDLLSNADTSVLLHGDLHHFNILSAHDQWVAIDPKGVIGEPAFEVGALLENPDPRLYSDVSVQSRRIDVLVDELGLDRERILGYGIAHAVLSAWWSYEDSSGGWEPACACAEVLTRLIL